MDELTNKNVQEFFSYNDMIQDDQSETSIETFKDINEFLENSSDPNLENSSVSESSSIYNSYSTDEKNLQVFSYVSKNFISKKNKQYKKCHTVSHINNMDSILNFPYKNYENTSIVPDKIKKIRNYQWKPSGKNVPQISLIKLSHKKAWDIGKEGCNGLLIESLLESYQKKKLNYIVLDGTDLDNFLTVYSHTYQDAIKGVNPSILNTFSFYDLENAYFLYDIKCIHIFRETKKKKKKTIILKDLNDNFFNAILVCMNEIIIYFKIANFKRDLLNKENKKKKKKKKELNEETHFVKSVKNENNMYRNSVKEIISANKRNDLKNSFINEEQEKEYIYNLIYFKENINSIREKLTSSTKLNSNISEESCSKCLNDIINKEKNEIKETGGKYNDLTEYTSHTSESVNISQN